jgi:hypothetical protein
MPTSVATQADAWLFITLGRRPSKKQLFVTTGHTKPLACILQSAPDDKSQGLKYVRLAIHNTLFLLLFFFFLTFVC